MPITSAIASSFKLELLNASHCMSPVQLPTGTAASAGLYTITVSAITGLTLGMRISGTGIAANTVIASIGASTLGLSLPTTAAVSGTMVISGDQFKMALFKSSPSGTYGAGTTNYSQMTGAADECAGTGYTAGGVNLSLTTPGLGGSVAYFEFSNAIWNSATFNTDGCMIYNSSARSGNTTGRCVAVFSFGSTQSVAGLTFTVVMPSNDSSNALVRLN